MGNSTEAILEQLNQCNVRVKPPPTDGIEATRLYPTNKNVDEVALGVGGGATCESANPPPASQENHTRLNALPGHMHTFTAGDEFKGAAASSSKSEKAVSARCGRGGGRSIDCTL